MEDLGNLFDALEQVVVHATVVIGAAQVAPVEQSDVLFEFLDISVFEFEPVLRVPMIDEMSRSGPTERTRWRRPAQRVPLGRQRAVWLDLDTSVRAV